ncbi:hypothetical protein THIOM_002538 [Candidatus Thiomargarita nelsonii]|uniref:Uncharacterized protein n=1 Tax=Candidatus Thiomargarita nelsonii TaxID=1003181 RepID=A0A176S197_9GAMM|nr:hypothetical protein THIOM_002538 [Candidatus Thiomargarita nelsonii]
MLLLETCVSFGNTDSINLCKEQTLDPTQSKSGKGCRPTRTWIYNRLKHFFEFVYIPVTQPKHEQFPINWSLATMTTNSLSRAIFIASKQEITNVHLVEKLLIEQKRHA